MSESEFTREAVKKMTDDVRRELLGYKDRDLIMLVK